MSNSLALSTYNDLLLSVRRGRSVDGVSQAKPLFLLAIIESVSLGLLTENKLRVDNKTLVNLYDGYCRFFNSSNKSPFIVPYYHLGADKFFHHCWKDGAATPPKKGTPSAKFLRENLLFSKFDDELWELIQNGENREYLRNNIIQL